VHGLDTLFLEVIALAIILLVVGLVAPHVLLVTLRAIMAPIVLMAIVGLLIIAVASGALMIIAIFTTAMLMVAQFTATCDRKLSCFPFLWLLILGNLLKNASCFVCCLTLLKARDHLEQVSRHCLVQVSKLVLVHLGLREEDLFTLLLRHRYVHRSTEVTTIEVAEKLYLTPCELMHRHESRLLRSTEPENQLVASVWESGNGLKVIPDTTLVEVCLRTICIVWASLCDDAGPLGQAYALKALTHEAE
jgi:hypothetical protein